MANTTRSFKDVYTRKVGGEKYEYEAVYSVGERVQWSARVFRDGVLKGTTGECFVRLHGSHRRLVH